MSAEKTAAKANDAAYALKLDEAHEVLAYRVLPIIRAAQNLADCRRVLEAIREAENCRVLHAVSNGGEVTGHLPACWRDPLITCGYDLLTDLLRVAESMMGQPIHDLDGCAVAFKRITTEGLK